MDLFGGKYRIESARLNGFDYASPGSYFVTIDTKWMKCWFGDVMDGEMRLSVIGNIVADEWNKTPTIRPTVTIDEWVVMPNHFHCIVMIHESESAARSGQIPIVDWETAFAPKPVPNEPVPNKSVPNEPVRIEPVPNKPVETTRRVVSTRNKLTLQPNSLGSIIGQFKSKCTKRIHAAGYPGFAWQERFWDRIIRDTNELDRIRKYIVDNPTNWNSDHRRRTR